jgi:TusA-related sulfurtransferase
MSLIVDTEAAITVGQSFLEALATQDFDRIEALFTPQVRFRALVPPGVREGQTAAEATSWLRRWFGDADELQVLQATANLVFDRLYVCYRLRSHDTENGWRVVEQHAYCNVQDGCIADMWLVCSGFRPDAISQTSGTAPRFHADRFYGAGDMGCADGPLEAIAAVLREMAVGQTLEIHATQPSVASDLPAWCRLAGHTLVEHEDHHYLVRRK